MRFAAAALALLILAGLPGPAAIQPAASQPAASQPAATSGEPADPVAAAYAAMTEQERMAIQEDLIWTGAQLPEAHQGQGDGDHRRQRTRAAQAAGAAASDRGRLAPRR